MLCVCINVSSSDSRCPLLYSQCPHPVRLCFPAALALSPFLAALLHPHDTAVIALVVRVLSFALHFLPATLTRFHTASLPRLGITPSWICRRRLNRDPGRAPLGVRVTKLRLSKHFSCALLCILSPMRCAAIFVFFILIRISIAAHLNHRSNWVYHWTPKLG